MAINHSSIKPRPAIKNKLNSIFHVGIDIGSISLNVVIINHEDEILENHYIYTQGRPFEVLRNTLTDIFSSYPEKTLGRIAYTGAGGKLAANLTGGIFINEIIAQSTAASILFPEVKTIIEMGGEDSKLIFMDRKNGENRSSLSDFSLNNLCAAGTGSFLDQQAKRIGVSIENEFGELALKSDKPPRIAGRCSVFAKSDMIHLQQIATPVSDIVAGLCFAVARNLKSSLGRGKQINPPVLFNGGVAANQGMVRAFREVLGLGNGELIVSQYHASMGALGAIRYALENGKDYKPFKHNGELTAYLDSDRRDSFSLQRLVESKAVIDKMVFPIPRDKKKKDVYLGLDVGSLSTNVVLIDDQNRVIARRYLPTASKPLEAIQRGIGEIYEEIGDRVVVKAAGTTGSGRYLTGDFIGADVIRNEITAQATAAIAFDPTVDTIFEIGGQDSKYIRIQNGVVVDFEMNKVCAAGTGSFLEEQSEKLGINIIGEFGCMALASTCPAKLGERCTVFMESDLNSHSQKGEIKENLVAGLAYSIVHNYLNRVVGNKPVGNKIFFQGGVTNNKSVVAAFENVTGKPIIVPPHFDVTGAIGAAILARDSMKGSGQTKFKGFDVRNRTYTSDNFECKRCNNHCDIRRVRIEGERKPLYYGGRCGYYEVIDRKGKGKDIPNFFAERLGLLEGDYDPLKNPGRKTIGIPRGLMVYFQQFPLWRTFFESLGFRVVVSGETTKTIITRSMETLVAETCFPVEVMHGHILELVETGVDYIFAPFIINNKADESNPTSNCNCPWVQTYSFMVKAAFHNRKDITDKLLTPVLHFRYRGVVKNQLAGFIRESFGISRSACLKALSLGEMAQKDFEMSVSEKGRQILENLPIDKQALVVISRPYNSGDPALNLDLVDKLINMDVIPIPMDFLPLADQEIFSDYKNMYWPNGQKILAASRIVANDRRLFGIYLGNFRCGPDSFLHHFVQKEMRGKPFLQLEVDEHSADAGMITRCEAFLDSLKGFRNQYTEKKLPERPISLSISQNRRKLYFPYMNDSAYVAAAACRACGLDSDVLPMQTSEEIELARKYTTGTECFPMIATTGSFLKKLLEPGTKPSEISFFMPDHNGPCRFGEYNKLQKQIFERAGFPEAEIISPSNDNSYSEMPIDNPQKFRLLVWKGFVAVDLMRKMLQERRPYETLKGSTDKVYREFLSQLVGDVEKGAKGLAHILEEAADNFDKIERHQGPRRPVIAVVGEIFMRDNPYCSAHLVERLENLGAETLITPFSEWLMYSTYRYARDSMWKRDLRGVAKANIQRIYQNVSAEIIGRKLKNRIDKASRVHLHEVLEACGPYIHRHYDGDPPMSLGNAAVLAKSHISGVANILPFTCMPGTLIASLSEVFRKENKQIPWVNIAFDGQEDNAIDTRLQAFMHQANTFARTRESN